MNRSTPLIIGYGNSLRTDDGIGWHAAERMQTDERFANFRVVSAFQLTPEMAYDFSESDLVVLVDAREDIEADVGSIRVREVHASTDVGISSHHTTPEAILGLVAEMNLPMPRCITVEVAARAFDDGAQLTAHMERSLDGVLDAVASVVANTQTEPPHR